MKAAKSGLTGYETAEELAAIAAGKSPAEVQQETAEAVHKENEILNPAPVDTTPQITGDKISYMSGTSDMQFDTSVPGYPMAVIQPGQDVSLPYGEAVSDADLKPYVDKVATAVTVGPVPEAQIEQKLLPQLAMRVGDAINMDYIRHDLNVIGATGLFSTVKPAFTTVPEGVALNYTVQMNPVVKKIDIVGNESISTADLMKLVATTPGTTLNTAVVSHDVANINSAFANAGYMMSRVSDVRLDDEGTLHLAISEPRIENINLRGNTKTKNKVIMRELRMKKGDIFNKNAASRSIQRVYNTGYFEDVNVRLLPGQRNPKDVIVEIDVTEQKTGSVTIGAGYSDSDGLVGILAVRATRPISAGNLAAIRIPIRTISSRIPIPTSTMPATPSASASSTANRNMTTIMKKATPSLNTTAGPMASTSLMAASAANTSAITSRWKRSGRSIPTMTAAIIIVNGRMILPYRRNIEIIWTTTLAARTA